MRHRDPPEATDAQKSEERRRADNEGPQRVVTANRRAKDARVESAGGEHQGGPREREHGHEQQNRRRAPCAG